MTRVCLWSVEDIINVPGIPTSPEKIPILMSSDTTKTDPVDGMKRDEYTDSTKDSEETT